MHDIKVADMPMELIQAMKPETEITNIDAKPLCEEIPLSMCYGYKGCEGCPAD